MVSFDPRGVQRSSPVECLTGPEMDKYTQVDQTPDDAAERAELVAAFKEFAAGCRARSERVLPHVSTVDAARDMDLLRGVLGDEKLNYVGASYGTFLGATYADLFPGRVGRLVLDGAMDRPGPPSTSTGTRRRASTPPSPPSPRTAPSSPTARSATAAGGGGRTPEGLLPQARRPARGLR